MKFNHWQIWVDTGGTFTDCLGLDPFGQIHRAKVLSNSSLRGVILKQINSKKIQVSQKWLAPPDFVKGFYFHLLESEEDGLLINSYDPLNSIIELSENFIGKIKHGYAFEARSPEEAPILAARLVTKTPFNKELPPISMRLATTRGTNALLERRGAPLALFITKGFADLLRIGTQQRPDLFSLSIVKPEPLYKHVVEVKERISANGSILHEINLKELDAHIKEMQKKGIESAAIALIHSYLNPIHEKKLAEYLLGKGFKHVAASSLLAPFIKLLPRTETAVADAYLAEVINEYLYNVKSPLSNGRLHVMTSAGGLVQPQSFHPKDSLLSGPAGGVVGAASIGRRSGYSKILAFDMGGTSTDVARYDGDFEYLFEHEVGDAHLVANALAIESVAAGGGSICSFDGTKLTVGPESAGASPGPACYGAGGQLTITDVNLLLGRLDSAFFGIPINIKSSEKEIEKLQKQIESRTGNHVLKENLLEGFVDIANERMADAIRRISLRKGYDPGEYALVAFGGAGGQHACGVANKLGIKTILIPEDAGLLSALGIGHSVLERFAEKQILKRLNDIRDELESIIHILESQVVSAVENEGVPVHEIEIRRRIINLRFAGQDSVLSIEYNKDEPLEVSFEKQYKNIFGHWVEGRFIEVESIRVAASAKSEDVLPPLKKHNSYHAVPKTKITAYFQGELTDVHAYERSLLKPGASLNGPALILENHSTTIVDTGWTAEIDGAGTLILRKVKGAPVEYEKSVHEIVRLELFTNRFRAIALEMGEMMRRTALSTNIKERLDFSCAILDPDGELVVNAPHIPVHLGAIGLCVRSIIKNLKLEAGDVVVTNHPAYGGSHLPDVTVVTPVFTANNELLGYVANRAHHAEIGGTRPGSMPPMAKTLIEEGVVILPTYLVKRGKAQWSNIKNILLNADYPTRGVEENIADLRAAVAANHKGSTELMKLADNYTKDVVLHYMQALKERAELKVREALSKLPNGIYEAFEKLDDETPLKVKIKKYNDSADIDFTGAGKTHPGNLNATTAIVHSVVIYVLRLLVNEPLPLNEGLMKAITLNIPEGILNPNFDVDIRKAPAVVGGNVETSQRLVDTLIKALRLSACSQGTMNNVLFGTEKYSYYETVCGGCGAGPGFNGASAVHSHMTNTRITDPEIVEHRYPVRIDRFEIRKNSGGSGKYYGGDGIIREITFLENMSLSIISQHRKELPYGIEGGQPGKAGRQELIQSNGEVIHLEPIDGREVQSGDRFILKTPGGGGYGKE